MRSILTLLATAAFSLHILLGCCWHHAHGAGEMPGHVHGPQAYDHVHVHGHGHCTHEHSDSDPEDHHEFCSDPQCIYLHAGPVTFEFVQPVALLSVVASDVLFSTSARPVLAQWDDRGKSPPDVPLFLAFEHFLN